MKLEPIVKISIEEHMNIKRLCYLITLKKLEEGIYLTPTGVKYKI